MISTAAAFLLVLSVALADKGCTEYDSMLFTAEGGLEIEYSRYMGTWINLESYDGRPVYACPGMDCQGLDRMLAWIEDKWIIVDCLPNDVVACGGSHYEIFSTGGTNSSCPYDDIAPWKYCTGDIIPGTTDCTKYEEDPTAKFTCL